MNRPAPAIGHMPFHGHRTQKQVREDEERVTRKPLTKCICCGDKISRMAKRGLCRKCAARACSYTAKLKRAAALRNSLALFGRRNRAPINRLPWCPPTYRTLYHHVRRLKKLGATEARRIVEAQIERDTRELDRLAAAIIVAGLRA